MSGGTPAWPARRLSSPYCLRESYTRSRRPETGLATVANLSGSAITSPGNDSVSESTCLDTGSVRIRASLITSGVRVKRLGSASCASSSTCSGAGGVTEGRGRGRRSLARIRSWFAAANELQGQNPKKDGRFHRMPRSTAKPAAWANSTDARHSPAPGLDIVPAATRRSPAPRAERLESPIFCPRSASPIASTPASAWANRLRREELRLALSSVQRKPSVQHIESHIALQLLRL